MIDRKGIFSFLAITFGLTWAIEIGLILSGIRFTGMVSNAGQYFFLPIMVMPALGAILTVKFITREGVQGIGLRFGSWKQYLGIGLLIPVLFALIYLLTTLLGLGQPDRELEWFQGLFVQFGTEVPPMPDTRVILGAMFITTLTVGTLINWLWCFGEELGWRGFLLPKLMPLGKPIAYLLLGIIWSAWHWPLLWMGFVYNRPGEIMPYVIFTLLTTAFGVFLNELRLRTGSSILAGWAHGVFNSQKLGIWFLLFPQVNPYLGGYAGLVGIIVWISLTWWEIRKGAYLSKESRQNKLSLKMQKEFRP